MFRILFVLVFAALICGCGLKGPLYHPDQKPASKSAVKPQPANPSAQGQTP